MNKLDTCFDYCFSYILLPGWPLGEIKVECISKNDYEVTNSRALLDGYSIKINTTPTDFYPLPLLSYKFVVNNSTNTSHIICTATNGDLPKYYKTITKVRFIINFIIDFIFTTINCIINCIIHFIIYISCFTVKLSTLIQVGWNCTSGWYGVEGDCFPCPKGMVSPPAAFEASQCCTVTSKCTAGMYGVSKLILIQIS